MGYNSKILVLEFCKPFGIYFLPQCVPDARHGDGEFKVCLAWFLSCLGLIPPYYFPISPFQNRNVYHVACSIILCWNYVTLFLLSEALTIEFVLNLKGDYGLGFLSMQYFGVIWDR